jgi:hypothetical protein
MGKAIRLRGAFSSLATIMLLSLTLGIPAAAAQDQQSLPESVPRVALSELADTPGAILMMPLYFTPDPKNPLRSITVFL